MPLTAAALDAAIQQQQHDLNQGKPKREVISGIVVGLLLGGTVAATCVLLAYGLRNRLAEKKWSYNHGEYRKTYADSYLIGGLGGGLGGAIAGMVGGLFGGPAFNWAYSYYKKRQLDVDASWSPEKALQALLSAAPHISDANLTPAMSNLSYRELVRLEEAVGARRMKSLVLSSTTSNQKKWAWQLVCGMREKATGKALCKYLTKHDQQLRDATVQVPGFLPHVIKEGQALAKKLKATGRKHKQIHASLSSLASHYYHGESKRGPDSDSSSEEMATIPFSRKTTIRVNKKALARQSEVLFELAKNEEGGTYRLNKGVPKNHVKGLKILLQVMNGERLLEDLSARQIRKYVYPAADRFGFEPILIQLDRIVKHHLESGELSLDDLIKLPLTPELERYCCDLILERYQPLSETKNIKALLHWLSDKNLRSVEERCKQQILEGLETETLVPWLLLLDQLPSCPVKKELRKEIVSRTQRTLRADKPSSLQLLQPTWDYALKKRNKRLKRACMRLVRSSKQENLADQLRKGWEGRIPNRLYTALLENPNYTPSVEEDS